MTTPNLLPGRREISFSHGHAHITRDGQPFASLSLGREGWGEHPEASHVKLAADARAIAAMPDLLARVAAAHELLATTMAALRKDPAVLMVPAIADAEKHLTKALKSLA